MADRALRAKNESMLTPPPPRSPRRPWLWTAPYLAVGVFAVAMLVITGLLQWRERDTALGALEGDMHWAERTIESRVRAHQDFLTELARDREFDRLDYESFQVRAARYVRDNPEIAAIAWVSTEGKVEWVAPSEATVTFVGDELTGVRRASLEEALRLRRQRFGTHYVESGAPQSTDLIQPVQRGSSDLGAFVAPIAIDGLMRASLPAWFGARYHLSLVDDTQREVFANSSVKPTDRRLAGAINLELADTRFGLNVAAYRSGGAWLPYVPAVLIGVLTLLAAATLFQLRRHAEHRASTEEQLRAAYAFRQAMSQSLLTGLRAVDLEGRITFVNAAFCRMTGFSEAELVGVAPPYPYWPPEEAEQLQRNIDTALAGRAPPNGFEMRIMNKSGERFDVRLYFSPLIDTQGKQIGWMASMNDITEPKRTRVELEQAHERFETVIDGLDAAVHVTDARSDEILFANRAFGNIFGHDSVGRSSATVTAACRPAPDDLAVDPAALDAKTLPRELYDGELRHNLSGRWYHVHEQAIRWVDGRTVRVQIAADITERKHLDEVTLEQQKRLEQTSRLITMGEMASSLAHELNQPLSAIANYCAGCIKRLSEGNPRIEDILAAMHKAADQAERAGKIIRRMRDMVKKEEPRREPVALADLIDETRALADIEARKIGVELAVELEDGLPRVVVDRIMIEQVLLNLMKNGIEAMAATPAGARRLAVTARLADGRSVEVAVADRGHGLADDDLERIFAPFYTTKPDGMGIGLAICRSMIEFHQGRLWPEPHPGGGTVFRFTLPAEEPHE
jgi:PAS domain S-box-containing protein